MVDDEEESLVSGLDPADPEHAGNVARLARKTRSPLALTGAYSGTSAALTLTFRAYDAKKEVLLGEETMRSGLGNSAAIHCAMRAAFLRPRLFSGRSKSVGAPEAQSDLA